MWVKLCFLILIRMSTVKVSLSDYILTHLRQWRQNKSNHFKSCLGKTTLVMLQRANYMYLYNTIWTLDVSRIGLHKYVINHTYNIMYNSFCNHVYSFVCNCTVQVGASVKTKYTVWILIYGKQQNVQNICQQFSQKCNKIL